jgi:pyruvate dehydrogenase E2 component (dihydrolipoamide acetyltransferase)
MTETDTLDILVPPLSQTMDTLVLVEWFKNPGDRIEKGEPLLSVETDKATLDVESPGSGILLGPLPQPGEEIKVRSVIGQISLTDAETTRSGRVKPTNPSIVSQPIPVGQHSVAPVIHKSVSGRILASPRARSLASLKGINLDEILITGTGPNKAIIEKDIFTFLSQAPVSRPSAPTFSPVARVTLVIETDASQFVKVLQHLEASVSESWSFTPGCDDLIALIVARALKEFPFMNARLAQDGASIEWLSHVNLGMAVDTERGIVVPVIRDADQKGLKAFGSEFRALVDRARSERSLPDDLSGGTFTITNLGMFEIDSFAPVINLPEIAILGLGRIAPKVVPVDGQTAIRQMWTLSLVFDHRMVDGAPAARFLQKIKQVVENPYLLLA